MVSPLTDRLLSGYSSAGSSGSLSSAEAMLKECARGNTSTASSCQSSGKPSFTQQNTFGGSSGGYNADQDDGTPSPSPPYSIELLNRQRKRNSSTSNSSNGKNAASAGGMVEHLNKRRRLAELAYNAHNAMNDATAGGLPLPRPRGSQRVFPPLSKVDMSRVRVVRSKEYGEASDEAFKGVSVGHTTSVLCEPHCVFVLQSLVRVTCAYYKEVKAPGTPPAEASPQSAKNIDGDRSDSESQSSTSSFTDTELEGNTSTLDDDDEVNKDSRITMGTALSISRMPRVITLSYAPYTVVHVNAAYLSMTGLTSVRVLGRPIFDLLFAVTDEERAWLALVNDSADADGSDDESGSSKCGLTRLHEQTLRTKTSSTKKAGGDQQCQLSVRTIGTGPRAVTHLSIELRPKQGNDGPSNGGGDRRYRRQPSGSEDAAVDQVRSALPRDLPMDVVG